MAAAPRTWHVERQQELREDADRLFVPAEDLADAVVGDAVIVAGADGSERRGAVIELLDDPERGSFAVVSLER